MAHVVHPLSASWVWLTWLTWVGQRLLSTTWGWLTWLTWVGQPHARVDHVGLAHVAHVGRVTSRLSQKRNGCIPNKEVISKEIGWLCRNHLPPPPALKY